MGRGHRVIEQVEDTATAVMSPLDETYFLRVLLTDPDSVIPAGKSLVSMLTNATFNGPQHHIIQRVTQVVHDAFWSEVRAISTQRHPV